MTKKPSAVAGMTKSSLFVPTIASILMATVPTANAVVNVQTFTPAANTTYVYSEDALMEEVPGEPQFTGQRFYFSAVYNFLNDPLVENNSDQTGRALTLIDGINTLDLTVGYQPWSNFMISVNLPFDLVHDEDQTYNSAIGDMRVEGKVRLTNPGAFVAVALVPALYIPTGSRSQFVSDGTIGGGLSLAIEKDLGPVRLAFNAGYRHFQDATFEDISYQDQFPLTLSALIPLSERWGINIEGQGIPSLPLANNNNPGEVYGGARFLWTPELVLQAGAAVGSLGQGGGAGDYRILFGAKFTPSDIFQTKKAQQVASPPAPVTHEEETKTVAAPPRVVFTAKEIKISEEVKFETGKDVLTPSGRKLLDEVADVMKANLKNFKKISIEGHCDRHGGDLYNLRLSRGRAAAVKEYLIGRGIDRIRLQTVGYGKRRPKTLSPDLSPAQQDAMNRRVEFKVIN
jgi:outer membrane protein OmpA-like peptidoglycan-associated protein